MLCRANPAALGGIAIREQIGYLIAPHSQLVVRLANCLDR